MNDASDAGTTSSLEQRSRVGDGVGEGRPASLESDPVRVVEGGDPFETARQRDWVLEPIRQGLDSCSEGMLAIRMMSKGSYLSSGIDQQFGDTRARVAERPRDQVRLGGTAAHGFRRRDSAGALARGGGCVTASSNSRRTPVPERVTNPARRSIAMDAVFSASAVACSARCPSSLTRSIRRASSSRPI
jgi:hypothetical protein